MSSIRTISSFDDFYYRDILIYCDMSVKGEEKIFEKLLLKKRFFESVFCNFTFHLEYISSNDKFPSIEKGILFNRILALYFYTNPIVENIGKMRFYFDERQTLDLYGKFHKGLELKDTQWGAMSNQAFATVADASWEDSCMQFEKALLRACERANKGEIMGVPSRGGFA